MDWAVFSKSFTKLAIGVSDGLTFQGISFIELSR